MTAAYDDLNDDNLSPQVTRTLELDRHIPTTLISKVTDVSEQRSKATSSPAFSLTADILSEVIQWLLPVDRVPSEDYLNSRVCPNNVAGVCRFWRYVALSRGIHWATIRLTHTIRETKRNTDNEEISAASSTSKIPLGILRANLRHSRDAPLTLDIHVKSARAPGFVELVQLVHEYRARCVDVRLSLPLSRLSRKNMDLFLRDEGGDSSPARMWPGTTVSTNRDFLCLEDMPDIRRLRLRLPWWQKELDLSKVPKLESLYIDICQRFTFRIYGNTSLQNLTTVIIDPLSSDATVSAYSCMSLLTAAADSLELFVVTVGKPDEIDACEWQQLVRESGTAKSLVNMSKLVHLGLYYDTRDDDYSSGLKLVLQLISAPHLQTLSVGLLDGEPDTDGWDVPLRCLLNNSEPLENLEHLTINTLSVTETCAALRIVPDLQSLELNIVEDWAEMIQELTPHADPGLGLESEFILCPKLKHLELKYLQSISVVEPLVNLVIARRSSPRVAGCFTKITLVACHPAIDIRQDARIAQYLANGLEIDVKDSGGSLIPLAQYCGLPGLAGWP